MDTIEYGVHERHCCVEHGCKYGDDDCPVVLQLTVQDRPCMDCQHGIPVSMSLDEFETEMISRLTEFKEKYQKLHISDSSKYTGKNFWDTWMFILEETNE